MTRPALDTKEVRTRHRAAIQTRTPAALWATVADVPALLAEIDRLRAAHALTRVRYANLLAAARATLAAHRDGENDPLFYVHDELAEHGQLPPAHRSPAELLAHATIARGQA
jgi:hypothetical protein